MLAQSPKNTTQTRDAIGVMPKHRKKCPLKPVQMFPKKKQNHNQSKL